MSPPRFIILIPMGAGELRYRAGTGSAHVRMAVPLQNIVGIFPKVINYVRHTEILCRVNDSIDASGVLLLSRYSRGAGSSRCNCAK